MPPWQELGIEPTHDIAVIRRAYALRLKGTRPDADPAGFQRLRGAYDAALRIANQSGSAGQSFETPGPSSMLDAMARGGPIQPSVVFSSVGEQAVHDESIYSDGAGAAIDEISNIISTGDSEAAVAAMNSVLERQILPIEAEIQLTDILLGKLLTDQTMATSRLLDIAKQFGWYGVPDTMRGANGAAERRLCARIDCELWLADLRRRARSWKFWFGQNDAAAARLLLGRGPILLSWIAPPEPQLSRTVGQAIIHLDYIGGKISRERLANILRLIEFTGKIRPYYTKIPRILYFGLAIPYIANKVFHIYFLDFYIFIFLISIFSFYFRNHFRPPVVCAYLCAVAAASWYMNIL